MANLRNEAATMSSATPLTTALEPRTTICPASCDTIATSSSSKSVQALSHDYTEWATITPATNNTQLIPDTASPLNEPLPLPVAIGMTGALAAVIIAFTDGSFTRKFSLIHHD